MVQEKNIVDVNINLAEITKDYPLIYNLVKKDCDEWWSREDIVRRVFPAVLISGDEEVSENMIMVG
jgi:hypothetical protein